MSLVGACLALPICLATLACRGPAAIPLSMLENDPRFPTRVPDAADHAAAQLAAAALTSDVDGTARALRRLEAIDNVLEAWEGQTTGLTPVSADLINATFDDPRVYRAATHTLLERDDLDPALRARLVEAERDDPLYLADARMRDVRVRKLGRAFNAVAEPVGRSILTSSVAPYRVAAALIQYAAELYTAEALTLQERQALDHWKRFVAEHPDSLEARKLKPRMEKSQARLNELHRNRAVRSAERALKKGRVRMGLIYADRALLYAPEDPKASELRERAARALDQQREKHDTSVTAAEIPVPAEEAEAEYDLALALLLPDRDVESVASALLLADRQGPLADEARFALALTRAEQGDEDDSWKRFETIAEYDDADSNMARHARTLVSSPAQNPYEAFHRILTRDRWYDARWVMLGRWYRGGPDRGIPWPIEWLIGAPAVARDILSSPVRLIQLPWKGPTTGRIARVYARRYLSRYPHGAHEYEIRDWLEAYETKRNNWLGVLAVAEGREGLSDKRRAKLRALAAQQAVDMASHESRRDVRNTMLRHVAREFPDTTAGVAAGHAARLEVEEASEQHIRISRGFLLENPEVAGPRGLALAPGLLDEDLSNGELHPLGVAFLGERTLEINLVAENSDEDDPPKAVKRRISPERLARLVSQLEETSIRNALLDVDDVQAPDAQRDVYFEKVRLGLSESVDPRAATESHYVYRGLRERYGVVRRREPLLPFDLVIRGSLSDMSIGAFPRIRKPRETPDAFLYK